MSRGRWVAALACCLVACSDSTTPEAQTADLPDVSPDVPGTPTVEPSADVTTVDGHAEDPHPFAYAPCPLSDRLGGFTITLADDFTGVNGEVADGVVPGNVPDLIAEEGDCRLLQKPGLFCAPACVPGETCGAEGACIPYPENQSVGAVVVTGLKEPLAMEPKWGNYYGNTGTMAHPGFEGAAKLTLSASGDTLPGFVLGGVGVSPLTVGKKSLLVEGTSPLLLDWEAASADDGIQMHVTLNINNHGSTSAWIACDTADSGELEIPQSLLEQLFQIGVSGFPSLSLSRRSVHSAPLGSGCVELVVRADEDAPIEVMGVTSCTSDNQCGPGQTCGADLQCHGS